MKSTGRRIRCSHAARKVLIEFLVATIVAIALISPAQASENFDIPNGYFRTIESGEWIDQTVINCGFEIEESRFGDKWLPSIAIILDSSSNTEDKPPRLKLSAGRDNEDEGWLHELTVVTADERESNFALTKEHADSVLPLSLVMMEDKYVSYFVGDYAGVYSNVDVSRLDIDEWEVIVSGVKGSYDCDIYVYDEESESNQGSVGDGGSG